MISNIHSDQLQELIHLEVCHSYRNTYMELYDHIYMRKQNILFKIGYHLPTVLSNRYTIPTEVWQ